MSTRRSRSLSSQALLGAEIQVPTIHGEEHFDIPPDALRHRRASQGEGIARINGRGQGDHFVQVNLAVPKQLTKDQRTLIEQLRDQGL